MRGNGQEDDCLGTRGGGEGVGIVNWKKMFGCGEGKSKGWSPKEKIGRRKGLKWKANVCTERKAISERQASFMYDCLVKRNKRP